jgi:hypothetical protein
MKQCVAALAVCCLLHSVFAQETERKFVFVDLQPKANQKLADSFGGDKANLLTKLPAGEHTLVGVRYKFGEGVIRLGSKLVDDMPDKVEGIKVGKAFAKLHILHATCFGGGPNQAGTPGYVEDGTTVGEYKVRYEDDRVETIPIVYGQDVRDWWYIKGDKTTNRAKIVWKGENEYATQLQSKLRLYETVWMNPRPDQAVRSIDFVSRKTETAAAPFVVAMSLEEK